jgi:hypothetical protein
MDTSVCVSAFEEALALTRSSPAQPSLIAAGGHVSMGGRVFIDRTRNKSSGRLRLG